MMELPPSLTGENALTQKEVNQIAAKLKKTFVDAAEAAGFYCQAAAIRSHRLSKAEKEQMIFQYAKALGNPKNPAKWRPSPA